VDLFWHHNPELKRAPLAWLTDFVGYLPMPEGGAREAAHGRPQRRDARARRPVPAVRDRALFVGDVEDVVTDRFGPGLPSIRDWTRTHFDFTGYITGFDPAELGEVEALRAELGYGPASGSASSASEAPGWGRTCSDG
jgi:hypothetical protein